VRKQLFSSFSPFGATSAGGVPFVQVKDDAKRYVKQVLIERFTDHGSLELEDGVIAEERVEFYLNGEKLLSVMCVPNDQDAHIVGFLMSEGVIRSVDQIKNLTVSDDGLRVDIHAEVDEASRQNLFKEKTLTSGCCVGVTGNVEGKLACGFVDTPYRVSAARILDEVEKFSRESELFSQTGCVHKALLLLEDGTTIESEDIGRHNAIDKAVGRARLNNLDVSRSVLFASGRLSMEMVVKCVMHRIPIVVSKASVTLMGIKSAQEYGITLAGFARNGKMNLYSHAGRIVS